MTDLDLRRLRYFLAVAETLNYGRAATVLRIAQPALSRSISALERELGVRLFDRSRAGTRLTPAGEALREEAEHVLGAARTLQRRVRVADREGRSVTIGFVPGSIVTPAVRHLEARFPGLRVDVVRTSWADQVAGLRDGRFDASLAHRPFDDEGLTIVDLYAEPRTVVLPIGHAYAGKEEVSLADLEGELLLQPVEAVPGWPGTAAGPSDAAVAPTVEEKLEKVAAGRGIIAVPESVARYYRRPDLTFVRVTDLPDVRACLVVESRRRSAVLTELLASAALLTDASAASTGT